MTLSISAGKPRRREIITIIAVSGDITDLTLGRTVASSHWYPHGEAAVDKPLGCQYVVEVHRLVHRFATACLAVIDRDQREWAVAGRPIYHCLKQENAGADRWGHDR